MTKGRRCRDSIFMYETEELIRNSVNYRIGNPTKFDEKCSENEAV